MPRTANGTLTANGNSNEITVQSFADSASGMHLHLSGTFGSGTATLQFKDAGGTWRNISGGAFTEAVDKQILLPNNTTVRFVLSGSTTPSLVYQMSSMSIA